MSGSGRATVNTLCNTSQSTVQITHAAHPLCGQSVIVQHILKEGQKHSLIVEWPDDGPVCCVPQEWTDQAIPGLASPGARFTPQQLCAVREWVDAHWPSGLDKSAKVCLLEAKTINSGGNTDASDANTRAVAGRVVSAVGATTTATCSPTGAVGGAVLASPTRPISPAEPGPRRTP